MPRQSWSNSARALLITVIGLCSLTAYAQSAATVTGIVTDQQGRPLPGAVVVAQHQPTGASVETATAADGRFSLAVPRAGGPYKIIVNMAGFAVQERRDVAAVAGEPTKVDFELQLAGVTESVMVTAGAALARDEKRSAATIMDVVAADSVGRFPDANAAEALRRVPGVSMDAVSPTRRSPLAETAAKLGRRGHACGNITHTCGSITIAVAMSRVPRPMHRCARNSGSSIASRCREARVTPLARWSLKPAEQAPLATERRPVRSPAGDTTCT